MQCKTLQWSHYNPLYAERECRMDSETQTRVDDTRLRLRLTSLEGANPSSGAINGTHSVKQSEPRLK